MIATPTSGPIEVTVLGGYLGAGKTTMLNHILRESNERVAVLVNDFGELNIDTELVQSHDGATISLTNGCICCSMIDGFVGALDQVRSLQPPPVRVVIEASGVANPSQVAAYAYGPGLTLASTVVVVDAERIARHLHDEYIADVIRAQLAAADLVVANKADLIQNLDETYKVIASVSTAPTVLATRGELPIELLLGFRAGETPVPMATSSDGRFHSWIERTDELVDRTTLEQRLADLPPWVVRAKGLVRLADAPDRTSVVQLVGRRLAITAKGRWSGGPSRIVLIGIRDESAPAGGTQPVLEVGEGGVDQN